MVGLLFQRLEVFPERGVLLGHGFFGDGQAVPVDEVGEGVFVEDVMGVEDVSLDLKIAAKLADADAVKGSSAIALEVPEAFRIFGELLGSEVADPIDQPELVLDRQLVELVHALITERDLEEVAGPPAEGLERAGGRGRRDVGSHERRKRRLVDAVFTGKQSRSNCLDGTRCGAAPARMMSRGGLALFSFQLAGPSHFEGAPDRSDPRRPGGEGDGAGRRKEAALLSGRIYLILVGDGKVPEERPSLRLPHTGGENPFQSPFFMAEIPLSLQLLLTQEAYLLRSKERMGGGRQMLQQQLEEMRSKERGMRLKFEKRGERDKRLTERQEVELSLSVMNRGLDYADRLLQEIRPKLESELEDLLRLTSLEYRQGLAAKDFQSDIVRCLRRFRDRVAELRKAIGIARNSMAASYQSAKKTYRDHALMDLEMAAKAAKQLEDEIEFFNDVANKHDAQVENTTFENVALPRLRDFPYESWIRTQPELGAIEVQDNFTKILQECDELLEKGIGDLFGRIQAASEERKAASTSFVHNYWKILRDYSCKAWVNEDRLDEFIENLERGMREQT